MWSDRFGLQSHALCANPVSLPACVAAGEITEAQAAAIRAAAVAAAVAQMAGDTPKDDNVVPFPDTKTDDAEQCDTDDIDPCEELLAALQVRLVQLLGRASQGIDVTFEVRQYQMALREFLLLCPELSRRAPKIPPELLR
jgi:hypothetical protein